MGGQAAAPDERAGANGPASPRLAVLAALGVSLAAIAVVTQLLPASVFARVPQTGGSPLTAIHPGSSGQLTALTDFAALLGVFAAAVVVARGLRGEAATRTAIAFAGLLVAIFVLCYPTSSLDVFKYVSDTRTLTVYHQNPLRVAPNQHPADPLYPNLPPGQQRVAGFYGPAFYVIEAPASIIAGDSPRANLIAFKVVNALAFVSLVALAARVASRLAPGRVTQAIVLAGWNPYLLYEGVGNAHNDLLMVALALWGIVLAAEGARSAGMSAWATGAGVKYVTAMTAPLLFVWLWRNSAGRSRRVVALSAALVLAAGAAYFATDPHRIATLGIFNETTFRTPYAVLFRALGVHHHTRADDALRWALLGSFAAVTVVAMVRMKATERSLYVACFWLLYAASALTVSYAWPWYFLWFVPLGAFLVDHTEMRVAIAASASGLVTTGLYPYVTHVSQDNWITIFMYGVPLVAVLPSVFAAASRQEHEEAPAGAEASVS